MGKTAKVLNNLVYSNHTASGSSVLRNHFTTLALTFRHCAKIDQHGSLQLKGAACLGWWVLHGATIYQFHMYSPKLPCMYVCMYVCIYVFIYILYASASFTHANHHLPATYRNRKSSVLCQWLWRTPEVMCIQGAIRWPKIQRSGLRSSCQSMCAPQTVEIMLGYVE